MGITMTQVSMLLENCCVLPNELLQDVADVYEGLYNNMASRIQKWYRFYKGPWYLCDDCGRMRHITFLKNAHSCDDWDGCCWKRVCKDCCFFYCSNNHLTCDTCETYFCDPGPDDRFDECSERDFHAHMMYSSRGVRCKICSEPVYIERRFSFDQWYDSHAIYSHNHCHDGI